jgi:hypothetical protein
MVLGQQRQKMQDAVTESKAMREHAETVAAENARAAKEGLGLTVQAAVAATGSAVAAKISADAATKSADTAEIALHRAERAYFAIDNIFDSFGPLYGHPVFTLKNTGRTPAVKVQTQAGVNKGKDLASTPKFRGTTYGTRASIPTQGVILHHLDFDIMNLNRDDYIFCEVTYEDIFGKPHCFRCLAVITNDHPHQGSFIVCGGPSAYDYAD